MLNKFFDNPIYKKYREVILCLIDLSAVLFSFGIAYWSKINFTWPDFRYMDITRLLFMMLTVMLVYAVSFFAFRIHKSLWKYMGVVETLRIGLSVLGASLILIGGSFLMHYPSYYVSIIFTAGLLTVLIMLNVRFCYRLLRSRTSNNGSKRAIIIGAGDGGYILLKEILQNNRFHVNVVGFIDDQRYNKVVAGVSVLGDTYDLPAVVDKFKVEVAFIAIPSANKHDIRRIVDICQSLKLETKIMKEGDSLIEEQEFSKRYPIEDISIEDLLGRGEIKLEQKEIESYITGKVILVTGAGGSIGSELCRQIVKFKPKKLIMLDLNENSLYMLEQEFNRCRMHGNLDETIEIVSLIATIREFDAIHHIFKNMQPDVVYHAAAHKHVPLMEIRPQEAVKNNVFGTNNVIKACIKNKVSRFIMISTDKAVNPTNVMGATKRMTEMLLQANGGNGVTKMAAVRFGNVLGSNGSVIPIFKKQIAEGGPVTITDKKIIRYFMTIPEAAQLVLQAGYYADKGEIFVLDMGEPVKILDLAEKMIRLSGYKPYEDIDIVEIGLRPGEKMFEELKLNNEVTSRTKNDLIFVNHVMGIEKKEIDSKLNLLGECLNKDGSIQEIRKALFQIIKDKDEEVNKI